MRAQKARGGSTMGEPSLLEARRSVFEHAAREEQVFHPNDGLPLMENQSDSQKDGHHQDSRNAIAPAVSKQSHHALVILVTTVVMRPVMKSWARSHSNHDKQLRHQQRHDGAPEGKTLEAEEP